MNDTITLTVLWCKSLLEKVEYTSKKKEELDLYEVGWKLGLPELLGHASSLKTIMELQGVKHD